MIFDELDYNIKGPPYFYRLDNNARAMLQYDINMDRYILRVDGRIADKCMFMEAQVDIDRDKKDDHEYIKTVCDPLTEMLNTRLEALFNG